MSSQGIHLTPLNPTSDDSAAFILRHAARRDTGIPTITVLIGPVGTARRTWLRWANLMGDPPLECSSDPLRRLREWAIHHRMGLTAAILAKLARRTGRDPEAVIRDWPGKTRADIDAFWNAVPPEQGDDLYRRVLSSDANDFSDERNLPHLLEHEFPGFHWPALFTAMTSSATLISWGELAQKHPNLSLTVAVPIPIWDEFAATAGDTRAKTILLEGEVRLPWMEPAAAAAALIAGGVPKASAEQLAKAGGDAEMIEATIALAKATAAPPATKEADDDARSKAERALFAYLENLPETAGRFELNANLDFRFGNKRVEIDLLCTSPKIAVEVDGYYHFRDAGGYRRDRSKDWELQKRGYLVLRFLAEDVTPEWGTIRDRILEAIRGRRTMSDLTDLPTEQPAAAPTLGERVRKILEGSSKALPFAKVKAAINPKGTAKAEKVSDADILRELESEGVHVHPAKAADGKPAYWHSKHVTAEEKAAGKAAEIERKNAAKAEGIAKKAADKARLKEEAAAATAQAKADKAEAAAKAKAEKEAEALRIKEEAATATAKAKAEKEAEAARKKVAAVVEALLKKVDELGDAPVAFKKPTAAAGTEAAGAFERTLKQLVEEGKIFAHPGGKFGRKAPLPPLTWYEKAPHKAPFEALVKSAQKLLTNDGVSSDEVFAQLRKRLAMAAPANGETASPKTETKPFDLADFARRVLVVAAGTGSHARPYHNKVFISAAWHDSQHTSGFPKMSIEEFKRLLLDANGKRLLNLSQANEVQMMNPQLVAESETIHAGSPFHFIRLEGDNP